MVVRAAQVPLLTLVATTGCAGHYQRILNLPGDHLQGEILYTQNCVNCHGETGFGGIGPSLVERLPALSDEEILVAIEEGPGDMAPFEGLFTNQELADLLLYITAEFQ